MLVGRTPGSMVLPGEMGSLHCLLEASPEKLASQGPEARRSRWGWGTAQGRLEATPHLD